MTKANSAGLALHYAAGDLENELAATRKMIARAPTEHFAWKPHEKSFSLGHLIVHLSELVWWGITTLQEDHHDFAVPRPPRSLPESMEVFLKSFDERVEVLQALISGTTEADLEKPWTLRNGETVIFTDTKGNVLRRWCTSHIVHHRGQLSVYLRLLNVSVPPTYGPTADEGW